MTTKEICAEQARVMNTLIKRGMKFALKTDHKSTGSKAGDAVKVTSITAMGRPSNGYGNDYEQIRVSNGKWTWRLDRGDLVV